MKTEKIKIFDTTLRDGEQAPGFSMNPSEKVRIAHQLQSLGVDVIEAGFPAASQNDLESVAEIADQLSGPEVCALARCHEGDIEKALKAVASAKKPRIHVFIATSDIHLEHKLNMSREQAIKKAVDSVRLVKQSCDRVDFSPEDAGRSDRNFLVDILTEVIKAGADTLNIPDTVGYLMPEEFGSLIAFLCKNVAGINNCTISTHCHNDLGLAVANSLSGVRNGARQVECTINGIGERAGNASLEEVVMAFKTRPEFFNVTTSVDTTLLVPTSKLLQTITGNTVQLNKAIVGANAFAHESGIHQHGVLKNRLTYEIMTAEDVGWSETTMVLGKHSGRTAVAKRLAGLGVTMYNESMAEYMERFKQLADKKKEIFDEDLIMLTLPETSGQPYELLSMSVTSETGKPSVANVALMIDSARVTEIGKGNGSIDAVYNAIITASGQQGRLSQFHVDAVSPEKDSVAIAHIVWTFPGGREIQGRARNTDTVSACAHALVDVLNRSRIRKKYLD